MGEICVVVLVIIRKKKKLDKREMKKKGKEKNDNGKSEKLGKGVNPAPIESYDVQASPPL